MSDMTFPDSAGEHSKRFPVLFGAFHIGGFRLPYFSTVISFKDVAESFSLVDECGKYKTQDWRLEELYQRSLNRERVLQIASRYLRPGIADRPPFFNSLTIALSAQPGAARSPCHVSEFPGAVKTFSLPGLAISARTVESLPEAAGRDVPVSASFGMACWQRGDQLMAVAIDGQHRLAAIKEFVHKNPSESSRAFMNVIVLVLDEEFGFLSPRPMSSVEAMRSVFIDLNKHAVPVSSARNVLLDDQSAFSRYVRVLISQRLALSEPCDEPASPVVRQRVRREGEFRSRIPLSLIDWHTEHKSKFDEGPYISSVLALSWCVDKVLKRSLGKDFKIPAGFDPDEDKPYAPFERAIEKLGLGLAAKNRLQQCADSAPPSPFHFSPDELESISAVFQQRLAGAFVTLFCGFAPYQEIVQLRMDADTVNPKFAQWYEVYADWCRVQPRGGELAITAQARLASTDSAMRDVGADPVAYKRVVQAINERKRGSPFFLLVTQRALVLALLDTFSNLTDTLEMVKLIGAARESATVDANRVAAEYFTIALNALVNRRSELFERATKVAARADGRQSGISDRMWAGSLFNADAPDTADFSELAARRASIWFRVLVSGYWLAKSRGVSKLQEHWDCALEGRDPQAQSLPERSLAEAMARLLPPRKKIQPNTTAFYESPANHLAGPPGDKISEQWLRTRREVVADRLALFRSAIESALK